MIDVVRRVGLALHRLPGALVRRVAGILRPRRAWAEERDPWTPMPRDVPLERFGAGASREFSWYFEGESRVTVSTLEELCEWLLACEYVRDPELFNERDFWQHPRTFEHLRKGDCEDHALWAWRKLVELGFEAELVSGEVIRENGVARAHVWVLFSRDGELHVLEGTARAKDAMVLPIGAVRDRYLPHWGVTGRLEPRGYAGYYHSLRRRTR